MQVDSIKTRAESAYGVCNQRLKLQYDGPLSNSAFDFNWRRYKEVAAGDTGGSSLVRRCQLKR